MSDAADGADLTLHAPPERLADLRRRARDVASLYGAGAHKGLGYHGAHLGAHRHGLRLADLPPLEASVEDVDGGARIHVRARRPPDVDSLRSSLRARVDAVQTGPCD